MTGRFASVAAVLSVAGGLALATETDAATTVGSSLRARANLYVRCASACTDLQSARPGGTSLGIPTDGILTVWRVRAASPGSVRLRVLRPQDDGSLRVIGASDTVRLDRTPVPGKDVLYTFTTRIAVRAGDRLALDRDRKAGAVFHSYGADTSWGTATLTPPPADGAAFGSPAAAEAGRELLLNADVEADQDGDGYGDDTQDACPKDAAAQDKAACPGSAAPAGSSPGSAPGAVDVGGPAPPRHAGPPLPGERAADKSERGHGGRPSPRPTPQAAPENAGNHGSRMPARRTPRRAGATDQTHGRRPAARPVPREQRRTGRRKHPSDKPSRPAPHRRRRPAAQHPSRPQRGAPPPPRQHPPSNHSDRPQRPAPPAQQGPPGLQPHGDRPARPAPGAS